MEFEDDRVVKGKKMEVALCNNGATVEDKWNISWRWRMSMVDVGKGGFLEGKGEWMDMRCVCVGIVLVQVVMGSEIDSLLGGRASIILM